MDFAEVFGPDVSVRDFFEEMVPRFYAARQHELGDYAAVPVIVSAHMLDTDVRYTVAVSNAGVEVEDDEMVDFPLLTILGYEKYWDVVKVRSKEIMETLDRRRDELAGQFVLDESFIADFERLDGVVDVVIRGPEGKVELSLVFNNYEADDSFPRFGVEIELEQIMRVARGLEDITAAAKGLSVRGDMSLAVDLGGVISRHLPG